jgi:hypothetical protein
MDKDEILESIQLSERVIFKLHPSFNMEDFEQDKENRPIEERDHAYSASKGRAMDTNMPDQQQHNEKTEAISEFLSFARNAPLLTDCVRRTF